MIGDLASVILLSYNRPEFLKEAIDSARLNAGYRHELILHDDGSDDPRCYDTINMAMGEGRASRSIFQVPGNNQGVGEAVRVGFAAAQGDVLVKFDQDCLCEPGWLARLVEIAHEVVQDPDGSVREVGMVGAFHYSDTSDERFRMIAQHNGWQEWTDFVGSVFVIRRDLYERYGIETHSEAFAEDVTLKRQLQADGYILALPDEDVVTNRGFGVGPSTVALGTGPGEVQSIHKSSVLFG